MTRRPRPFTGPVLAGAIVASVVALTALTSQPAWTDDRDLLRFDSQKPYLLIIFDNSSSMNLNTNNQPVPANGDDPNSKEYQAKQVVYEVFQNVNDVQLAFASFNQDEMRVQAKHWLYRVGSSAGSWPLAWPAVGEEMVFGKNMDPTDGIAGTCSTPLDLDNALQRLQADRFAKLEINDDGDGVIEQGDTNDDTVLWIEIGGTTYELTVSRDTASGNPNLGQPSFSALFKLRTAGGGCVATGPSTTVEFIMNLERAFFYHETQGETGGGGGGNAREILNGVWTYSDTLHSFAHPPGIDPGTGQCGIDHPFSGEGWEGNYDGTTDGLPPASPPQSLETAETDSYSAPGLQCDAIPGRNAPPLCTQNLKWNTEYAPAIAPLFPKPRPLDEGDFLPFKWDASTKIEFLRRLAPSIGAAGVGVPDFGVANYFTDLPPPGETYLKLRNQSERPLIPLGVTPIAKAVNDFRCFYQGDGNNKCRRDHPFSCDESGGCTVPMNGWESIAQQLDPDWGCRKVYQIVLSDGDDTCEGENACADTANLNNKAGVRTWVVAYGKDCDKLGNPLHCMVQNGKGEAVCPQNPQNLKDELERILGLIREQTRAFAAGTVTTVQTTSLNKIGLSSFTPLQGEAVWDGHFKNFLKPLPLFPDTHPLAGQPNTDQDCASQPANQQDRECFLWDTGEVMKTQVDAGTPLGTGDNQRRVFYSLLPPDGRTWIQQRRLFDPTDDTTANSIRLDLWQGLGIPPAPPADAQTRANAVIAETFALKTATVNPTVGAPFSIEYIQSENFHSTPLFFGDPVNTEYFVQDLGGDGVPGCASGERGYRCFFLNHEHRREMLVFGTNAGMLHFFDAGIARIKSTASECGGVPPPCVKFDNGTGKELFAYIPRAVMPTITQLAEGTSHRYGVDGTVTAADVFIDPEHTGLGTASSDPPQEADRRWRTGVMVGLREGGRSYVMLDVTQPDVVNPDNQGFRLPEPQAGSYQASCLADPTTTTPTGGCRLDEDTSDAPSQVPFPAALWEFSDWAYDATGALVDGDSGRPGIQPISLDEDDDNGDGIQEGNSEPDLGWTWSQPSINRIRLCRPGGTACDPTPSVPLGDADLVDRYVAVVGGGMPEAVKEMTVGEKTTLDPTAGNWIYVIDVETGQAIYKRQIQGAVAAQPAAVDSNSDGYVDRTYIVTTAGFVYRVDFDDTDTAGNLPEPLQRTNLRGTDGCLCYAGLRIPELDADGNPLWVPVKIFDANSYSGDPPTRTILRSIYHRPSVIFVSKLGEFALAFGTGDREDLWSPDNNPGRFYVFVDESHKPGVTLPLTEASLQPVDDAQLNVATSVDYLFDRIQGQRGWFLILNPKERVISNSFAFSGITVFNTFEPVIQVSGGQNPLCSRVGTSRIFAVLTTNANAILKNAGGQPERWKQISTFATPPYDEVGQNLNPGEGTGGPTSDDLTPDELEVMETLKTLLPKNCRFANYRIDIKAVTGDTRVVTIAPVPICIVEKNWKEF